MYPALINFIKQCKSIKTSKNQIGRWCNPNCPNYFTNAMLIMDRSNEDNCGICGDYSLLYLPPNEINNKIDWCNLSEEDIYYYPYTM